MISELLAAQFPIVEVDDEQLKEQWLEIYAHRLDQDSVCPACGQVSRSVHSHYVRKIQDYPIGQYQVRLVLRVRRFRCNNPTCSRQTFTEGVGNIAVRFARRTERLNKLLRLIGLASSGQAGSRLSEHLHMGIRVATPC
jgi:transposase